MFLKKMFSTLSVQAKTIVPILVILKIVVGVVTLFDFPLAKSRDSGMYTTWKLLVASSFVLSHWLSPLNGTK